MGGVDLERYLPHIQDTIIPVFDIIAHGHTSGQKSANVSITATGNAVMHTVPADELWRLTHWHFIRTSGTFTFNEVLVKENSFNAFSLNAQMRIDNPTSGSEAANQRGALDIWLGPSSLVYAGIDTLAVAGNLQANLAVQTWKVIGKI
jgi:hypothetical protein